MSFVTSSALGTMAGGGGPPWWTWLVIGVVVAAALASDTFVYRDARSRGLSGKQAATWVAGCVVLWLVMFPLWFVMRGEYADGQPSDGLRSDRAEDGG